MNKNILYAVLLLVFISAAGFVIIKFRSGENNKKNATWQLLDRKGILANTAEWPNTQKNAVKLSAAVKAKPADIKPKIALANLFIMEARATGNYAYYDKAAMQYVNDVLAQEPQNFEALTLKSLLHLSQHHFADGLAVAKQAEKINPFNAFLYGILVDAHVEMGNYDSAVMSAEKMMSIRPDLRSYARASYLREIYGDYPGAIEAMKLAVVAGIPGDESTEWCRVQLGHLYENTGDFKNAEISYSIAVNERPGYVHGLAGLARLALAAKDYNKSITLYLQADSLVNDFSFKEELVDVYQLAGQKDKAVTTAKTVIDEMGKSALSAATDESIGHYADKELAYAYLKVNNYDKALEHALAEYNRRPKNIDVNETVAWVYYQKGEFAKALPYMQVALKTNSKNPVLLSRAGLIYEKAGDKVKAKECLREAFKNKANIPEHLKVTSEQVLKEI